MSWVAAFILVFGSVPTQCQAGDLINYDQVAQLISAGSQRTTLDPLSRALVQGTDKISQPSTDSTTSSKASTTTAPTTKATTTIDTPSTSETKTTTKKPTTSETKTTTGTPTTSETKTTTGTPTTSETKTATASSTSTKTSTKTHTTRTATSTVASTTTAAPNTTAKSLTSIETASNTTTDTFTATETATHTPTSTSSFTETSTSTATVTPTSTSTVSSTQTDTSTLTVTVTTTTKTNTDTSTSTLTVTQTTTQTTTVTATSTTPTFTSTTTQTTTSSTQSTTTTTPYCFETDIQWGPVDMPGTVASSAPDEFACQEKCLRTPGCSHFSFWKAGNLCHLEDRYAQRRTGREGYVSGPFQCWSYLIPGKYTRLYNHTYVPKRFRCMEIGVTWSPDMTTSSVLAGERDEVVFACQQQCRETDGCKHFTVMFPNLCRLADQSASPILAESAISGPPTEDCDDPSSESTLGHTFMRKFSSDPVPSSLSTLSKTTMAGSAFLGVAAIIAGFVFTRARSATSAMVPQLLPDLEESFAQSPQE